MEDLLGRLLGPYQLIARLERPGPYPAFRAVDRRLFNRPVTVTVFARPPGAGALPRFERVAEALTGLRHPYILPVQDFGEQDALAYAVSPYLDGPTLAACRGRPCSLEEALRLVAALGDALDYAHRQGLAHGGLTADTILLANVLPGDDVFHDAWPFLADFGFLGLASDAGAGIVLPELPPHAPEAGDARRSPFPSAAPDLYALAAVLAELLTGARPGAADAAAARAGLPPALGGVLARALAPEPADRYASGAELVLALQEAMRADSQGDDAAAPALLETARAAVTAGRLRAARRAYTDYLRLRPADALAQRELAAVEGRLIHPRHRLASAETARPAEGQAAAGAAPAAKDATSDDQPAAPPAAAQPTDQPAPDAAAAASPAPAAVAADADPSRPPARRWPFGRGTAPAPPEGRRANQPPARPPTFKPLVAPARERQRLILPSVLGAVALVVLVALVGPALVRRTDRATGTPVRGALASPRAGGAGSAVALGGAAPTSDVPATLPVAPTPAPVTPTPVPTAPPLPPVFTDEFNDPSTGFPRQLPGQQQPPYWQGVYIIQVAQADGYQIAELNNPKFPPFGDLSIEADMAAIGATNGGSYGLVFHRQAAGGSINEYFALINPEAGTVRLVHWDNGQHTDLLPPTPNAAVKKGGAINHLTVVCKATLITLYVNGTEVFQTNDPNGPQGGTVGLRVDAGTGPIEVHFDNVMIRPVR
ncbi:MAG TPA: family 16 glycoside hydrolase [Thermomicrobiales bacterium]|nr:family 16 glycoside hydrolase [Thermomicrobiales bacterium]